MTTNATEVKIRHAVEADRETLIELIIRGFEDVTVHRWRELRYGVIGGRTWDEWKADDMCQIDMSLVVIAEVEGEAVGFATYHLNKVTSIGTVGNNAVNAGTSRSRHRRAASRTRARTHRGGGNGIRPSIDRAG